MASTSLNSVHSTPTPLRYGVIGGLGAIGSADVLNKIVRTAQQCEPQNSIDISFEQRKFDDGSGIADENYSPIRRKFYVYNLLKNMTDKVDHALIPCFLSHTFIEEITPEISFNVVDIFDALLDYIKRTHPNSKKIGVLTSSYVRDSGIFERKFENNYEIVYPNNEVQRDSLMKSIYGKTGIKNGHHSGNSIQLLLDSCHNLIDQGVDIIVPGLSEIPVLIDALQPFISVPILDSNQIYADYALLRTEKNKSHEFKLGILGGVGPAATVDFMRKIVNLTEAKRDQDHIKIVVEQNPQIPDRTANLISNGDDPSIAMLATCQKLESDGANAIAIPCNTAHAFVTEIQSYIGIPIINMLTSVVDYIENINLPITKVGLLATSGTVASGVYHKIIGSSGRETITPSPEIQVSVMEAIYGSFGVKAGYVSGECSQHVMKAIQHLSENGAEVIILGCTELPLINLDSTRLKNILLLDPTEILAQRCVALAKEY